MEDGSKELDEIFTEEELTEMAYEKQIADYQEHQAELEQQQREARAHDLDGVNQTKMQEYLQALQHMSLPQLRLVKEHVDHETQLLLHEDDLHDQ